MIYSFIDNWRIQFRLQISTMFIHSVQKCTVSSMDIHETNAYFRHIRKVHENDDRYGTTCPLYDSKFIYTDVISFIHQLRKHTYGALHVRKTFFSLCWPLVVKIWFTIWTKLEKNKRRSYLNSMIRWKKSDNFMSRGYWNCVKVTFCLDTWWRQKWCPWGVY
jgi:hypothetical protein